MAGKIIFCQMTQNRLPETKACVERYLNYVDEVVIVDGGSIDDSIFYFRNWSQEDPKIHFQVIPWCDKFAVQRNNYLRIADTLAKPGDYILVSDPDELFDISLLENLHKVASYMDKQGANVACFQSRSVSLKGDKRVHVNLDDYWKHLFYKWEPGMYYVGNPHETLVIPSNFRPLNFNLAYEHTKQENITWHRGARNFFCWGVGRSAEGEPDREKMSVWGSLMSVINTNGIPNTWHAFDTYLIKGNINKDLRDWFTKYKDIDTFEFSSEARELYKLYFEIYHPEELG